MDDVYYSKSSIEEAFKNFPLNWNSFIKDTINSIKPSDVEPVVHGTWEHLNWGFDYDCCSVCGYEHRWTDQFYFCPICGARLTSEEFSCPNTN